MAKAYVRPTLVEYGTLERLTLGAGGTLPDFGVVNGQPVLINNNCDASPPSVICPDTFSG